MNVLFCDDEPDLLEIYCMECDYYAPEHTYFQAQSPDLAVKICQDSKIDILFTDLRMPNMSGLQLIETLREKNIAPPMAFLITGHTYEFIGARHDVFNLVERVITKPPNFEDLAQIVKEVALKPVKK